jgi:hypothetical protein
MTLRNYLEVGAISRRYAIKQALNLSDREVDKLWEEIAEEANNPIFVPVAVSRNGLPVIDPDADPDDGGNDTTPRVVPATGADAKKTSTTNNGISRGQRTVWPFEAI